MSSSDIALIVRWVVPLWLLGWAVFPLSRRLFSFLPDQGLAAGRVLALVLGALVAFWLASIHLLPLAVGAFIGPVVALVCANKWADTAPRRAVREIKAVLVVSDCVFLLTFAFFAWVRLRHPSINDLEKPMDLALLSQSARAQFLPFENFWFAGTEFTNYYYFGPFMGGTLARLLGTPAPLAYNLVQPLFCALFLSVLWSLGAALSKSKWLGLGVMALVGLGGHLEPLRQLREGMALSKLDWWTALKTTLSQLDWWKTSRVIPNTINEYPAFTLLIGDAHAHFYALALAVLHFCVCLGIVCVDSARKRAVLVALGGVMLGVSALTNTWDVPFQGVLWGLCVLYAHRKHYAERHLPMVTIGAVALTVAVALPFFVRFRSQVGGGDIKPWIPELYSFSLFWGSWIALGAIAFGFGLGKIAPSREGDFRRMLLLVGILALAFPSVYYLGGIFAGGDYRHQDTVFKFYLQAWLLGGTAIASEFLLRFRAWNRSRGPALGIPAWTGVLMLVWVLSLAPYATWKTRTQGYGEEGLSLDGGKWLPQSDRKAIEWLREQNGVVAEQLPQDRGGDYDANRGAIATQSGLPAVLCWPQHVRGWGFQNDATREAMLGAREEGGDANSAQSGSMNAQVDERVNDLIAIFGNDAKARRALVKKHGISFIVVRPDQAPIADANFLTHEFNGDDGSKTLILERKGF